QALFVMETDLVLVKLALSVCDLAESLATGKLILLLGDGDQIQSQLSEFMAHHPGLEPPMVMHPLPAISGDRRHDLLAAGEAAIRAVVAERMVQMDFTAKQLAALPPSGTRIAMFVAPRHRWDSTLPDLSGIPSLALDDPIKGGRLARMQLCLANRPVTIVTN